MIEDANVCDFQPEASATSPMIRFFEAAGCRTQLELASFLGIRQSSISDAKRRGAIPPDWLLTLLHKKGINPHWITTGQGPRHMHPCDEGAALRSPLVITSYRPAQECSMEELLREMMRRVEGHA